MLFRACKEPGLYWYVLLSDLTAADFSFLGHWGKGREERGGGGGGGGGWGGVEDVVAFKQVVLRNLAKFVSPLELTGPTAD